MTYNFEQRFSGDNCEHRKASDLTADRANGGGTINVRLAGHRGWSRLYIVFSAGLLDIMVAGSEPSRVMTQRVLKC